MTIKRPVLSLILAAFAFLFLIPALSVLMGIFLDRLFGWGSLQCPLYLGVVISAPILAVGGYLTVLSNLYLYRRGRGFAWGDAQPSYETRMLVTEGPYRYTRNPMILGYTLILAAVGVIVGSPAAALIVPPATLIGEAVWIKRVEEPRLERRFGRAYLEYKRRVPFLIPIPKIRRKGETK